MSHILAILVFAAGTSGDVPQPAPDFDETTAIPSVIVATSRPGDSYAEPAECTGKNVICMHYPLWFQATLVQPVFGIPPKQQIVVTTYTHYGQPEQDDATAPRILLLLENNGTYVMPVYSSERVWRRSDGQYFLLMESPLPVHWLPCSADYLREPVDAARFPPRARLALDHYSVRQHPDLFLNSKRYAFPRFGISVSRLSDYLQSWQPDPADFRCGDES